MSPATWRSTFPQPQLHTWQHATSGAHSPRKNDWNRARSWVFGTRGDPAGRQSSIRGRKSHSFHARVAVGAVMSCASRMSWRVVLRARRNCGLQKGGGVRNKAQGCATRSVAVKGSKLAKAACKRGPCNWSADGGELLVGWRGRWRRHRASCRRVAGFAGRGCDPDAMPDALGRVRGQGCDGVW